MRRTPLRRTAMRRKRATPRRREAPRWTAEEWDKNADTLYRRSGLYCECCGKDTYGVQTERHHRQRRRDGGDRLSNLLLLRRECHQYWTEHPTEAKSRGIIVPPWTDPADTPVLLRGTSWSLLTDDGTTVPLGLGDSWRLVG